ncbi:hypothetical protein AVEN_14951-1 [Araneus ventricosus]|uniref:Uncharacterized protein n=1 Tax=Araneus ventricosus TaxID=182803 RepID=A0A4Y2F9N3_ARAVE|nr:hypothetical protein AVEN_14951-1 [Araneus ventricosus]
MVEKLEGSFYVDNCLTGVNDPCDQVSFIERTQTLMSRGGFNLRGLMSNEAWEFISKHSGDASVLGLLWNWMLINGDATLILKFCLVKLTVLEAETSVLLICAKTRVAPLKPLTIPRLELMACCIGARLVNSIRDALNLSNIKVAFWSDSEIALWWIKEHGDWPVFVTNRVQEIRQLTQFQFWRHVPGILNVADMMYKGCSARRLLDSRYWEGPTWFKDAPENWPKGEICCEPLSAHTESEKSELVILNVDNDCFPWYCLKKSNYNRMINVCAYILRFVNNCQKICTSINDSMLFFGEINKAEKCLIKLLQCQFFKTVSDLKFISVFKDDNGILRIKTKITYRKDDESFLAPTLLPEESRELVPLTPSMFLIETVRVKNQKGCMVRPIQRLFPLEMQSSDPQINMEGGGGVILVSQIQI